MNITPQRPSVFTDVENRVRAIATHAVNFIHASLLSVFEHRQAHLQTLAEGRGVRYQNISETDSFFMMMATLAQCNPWPMRSPEQISRYNHSPYPITDLPSLLNSVDAADLRLRTGKAFPRILSDQLKMAQDLTFCGAAINRAFEIDTSLSVPYLLAEEYEVKGHGIQKLALLRQELNSLEGLRMRFPEVYSPSYRSSPQP